MGGFVKIIDAILLLLFMTIAVAAPLIHAQLCLPLGLFPESVVQYKNWCIRQYDDYLFAQMPHFFVGLVWAELVFQWPLALANVYGILASKSWYSTTCLIYGASFFTSMVSVLTELFGSGKASDKLLALYSPFLGLALLAILRGLLPPCTALPGKRVGPPKFRKIK